MRCALLVGVGWLELLRDVDMDMANEVEEAVGLREKPCMEGGRQERVPRLRMPGAESFSCGEMLGDDAIVDAEEQVSPLELSLSDPLGEREH